MDIEDQESSEVLPENGRATLGKNNSEVLDPILYHYTDARALVSILEGIKDTDEAKNRKVVLRGTDYRFLNDSTERVLLDAIEEKSKDFIKKKNFPSNSKVLDLLQDFMQLLEAENAFITSFTSEGDDLSQWRAYAHDGYAIGFKKEYIENYKCEGITRKVIFNKCVYFDVEKFIQKNQNLSSAPKNFDMGDIETSNFFDLWDIPVKYAKEPLENTIRRIEEILSSSCDISSPNLTDEKKPKLEKYIEKLKKILSVYIKLCRQLINICNKYLNSSPNQGFDQKFSLLLNVLFELTYAWLEMMVSLRQAKDIVKKIRSLENNIPCQYKIDYVDGLLCKLINKLGAASGTLCSYLSSFIKYPGFHTEKEWRLVCLIKNQDLNGHLKPNPRDNGEIVSYIEHPFTWPDGEGRFPVEEIVIAPTASDVLKKRKKQGLVNFLQSLGCSVVDSDEEEGISVSKKDPKKPTITVKHSKIPYIK